MSEAFKSTNSTLLMDVPACYDAIIVRFRRRKVAGAEEEDDGAVATTGRGDELLEVCHWVVGIDTGQVEVVKMRKHDFAMPASFSGVDWCLYIVSGKSFLWMLISKAVGKSEDGNLYRELSDQMLICWYGNRKKVLARFAPAKTGAEEQDWGKILSAFPSNKFPMNGYVIVDMYLYF